jgi:hypothetical protein
MMPEDTVAIAPPPSDAPPATDAPSARTYDWREVHRKAMNTAHVAQAWGAGGTFVLAGGLVLRYVPFDWTVEPPTPLMTGSMIGIGAGLATIGEVGIASASLRSRYAAIRLGGEDPGVAGAVAGMAFAFTSGALWVSWGVIESSDATHRPALAALGCASGVGAWVAGTVQLALDKQHLPEEQAAVMFYAGPTGVGLGGRW